MEKRRRKSGKRTNKVGPPALTKSKPRKGTGGGGRQTTPRNGHEVRGHKTLKAPKKG